MQFPVFMYVHMHAYICNVNMYACVAVRFCFYTLLVVVCVTQRVGSCRIVNPLKCKLLKQQLARNENVCKWVCRVSMCARTYIVSIYIQMYKPMYALCIYVCTSAMERATRCAVVLVFTSSSSFVSALFLFWMQFFPF